MTYCVAISVDAGMVFCSDSLTNAGVDQVSTYRKMFRFGIDGEKQFVILTSGNLATCQATIAKIKNDISQNIRPNLLTVLNLEEAADYVGDISREQQQKRMVDGKNFEASFIVGGQVRDGRHEITMIYPEGNYITTSEDTNYLQIGESKYGKPILDRILSPSLDLDTCAMCALVSMDSTMRSNLSVGPPVELLILKHGDLTPKDHIRFDEDSNFLRELKKEWDEHLKDAFRQMPPLSWAANWDKSNHEQSGTS
ncbi:MAG: peptidase [Gammaproteobacteria bacterium]|nr:peptidase [Gammaproteobacteria bacterium]MCY4357516.1 peptidase [Gammaproteobacteria bacterium]